MSAFTNVSKSPLLGFVKKIFRKSDARINDTLPKAVPQTAPATTIAPPPAPVVRAPAAPSRVTVNGNGGHDLGKATSPDNGTFNGIQLPLQCILDSLPVELRDKLREPQVGDLTVPIAYDKILSQLAQGVVRVQFGLIRQAVPFVFAETNMHDHVPVMLPLNEILSRLNPALLVRRNAQKQVAVPAEIVSPFAARGADNGLLVGNAKPPVTPAAPRTAAPPPMAPPSVPGRGSIAAVPTPLPPGAGATPAPSATPKTYTLPKPPITPTVKAPIAPPTVARQSPTPAELEALIPMAPIPMNKPVASPAKPAALTPPVSIPTSAPIPMLRVAPPTPLPAPAPAPAAPIPPAIPMMRAAQPPVVVASPREMPAPKSVTAVATLSISLAKLAESWPDDLRQEITQSNLAGASVALPVAAIETALKRGRVLFAWKVLRAWIQPVPPAAASPHDETELDLPLAVIAPLFLTRKNSPAVAKTLAIDAGIPNLFFGFPKADAAAPAAPLPSADAKMAAAADTNYYVFDDCSEASRLEREDARRKSPSPTGTEFVAKYATPNEIVSRAASLDGVAGALIALPDGLMVASRVPAELNGDTLAAFLPQIFSKVSMCTKELRMGDLNNLNFTVGNVPWKIFRVNAIFFAAFGRAAEALPTAQLAALAAELDRKHK